MTPVKPDCRVSEVSDRYSEACGRSVVTAGRRAAVSSFLLRVSAPARHVPARRYVIVAGIHAPTIPGCSRRALRDAVTSGRNIRRAPASTAVARGSLRSWGRFGMQGSWIGNWATICRPSVSRAGRRSRARSVATLCTFRSEVCCFVPSSSGVPMLRIVVTALITATMCFAVSVTAGIGARGVRSISPAECHNSFGTHALCQHVIAAPGDRIDLPSLDAVCLVLPSGDFQGISGPAMRCERLSTANRHKTSAWALLSRAFILIGDSTANQPAMPSSAPPRPIGKRAAG